MFDNFQTFHRQADWEIDNERVMMKIIVGCSCSSACCTVGFSYINFGRRPPNGYIKNMWREVISWSCKLFQTQWCLHGRWEGVKVKMGLYPFWRWPENPANLERGDAMESSNGDNDANFLTLSPWRLSCVAHMQRGGDICVNKKRQGFEKKFESCCLTLTHLASHCISGCKCKMNVYREGVSAAVHAENFKALRNSVRAACLMVTLSPCSISDSGIREPVSVSCVRGQGLTIFLIRSTIIFATFYVCNRVQHYTRFPGSDRLNICIAISAFKWLSRLSSLHNGRLFIPLLSVAVASIVNAFTFRCGLSTCSAPLAVSWLWITGAFATTLTHNTSNWNSNERNVIILKTSN